ncbi:MAG: putative metal-dependent hydrolase [Arenicella sp.]|jgi:predicted metal-dependent hydrolase
MTEQVDALSVSHSATSTPVSLTDNDNAAKNQHSQRTGKLNPEKISARSFKVEYEGDVVDSIPKKWVDNDIFLSHLLNGYSLFIPDGEKINCICVKPYVDKITSKELKMRARGLLAQEATHGIAHTKFLHMLEKQGYNTQIFLSIYQFIAYKMMLPVFPLMARLAFVTAIERINELLGEITLKSKMLDNSPLPAAKLYKWHFAEEIEHKCVVFDVYHHISNDNKWLLAFGTICCYVVYMSLIFFSTLNFMVQDGSILNPRNWLRGFRFMFTKEKAFWVITGGCIALIRRDFHPSQRKNLHLAEAVLQSKVID